jgi:hypothetical protein
MKCKEPRVVVIENLERPKNRGLESEDLGNRDSESSDLESEDSELEFSSFSSLSPVPAAFHVCSKSR